ncbi:MAG: BtrH N-terminal domain-containing protein [bacterium]|nr:BtrH N-terminal domain-containing protein [bacterium]
MKQLLKVTHRVDDYVCMWNGIEDLYIMETHEKLPPMFFFSLASFGSFCYMKTNKSELKRMVALGDGRTKKMYEFLAPIVGFDYKHHQYSSFKAALTKAKSEIDNGYPCILGALDMYYLHYYPKLYHTSHIPFHYVMMIGYDDEAQYVYINDCGREQIQEMSYEELKLAWDCSYPGLSKPNTVCSIRMHSKKNVYEIAQEALAKKCDLFLNPPVGFLGHRGLDKFMKDLPNWKKELSKDDYDKILYNMVQFFGTVPTIPNALQGSKEEDEVAFGGGFDKISVVLEELGREYQDERMKKAAGVFSQGAAVIEKIKVVIVEYLIGERDRTDEMGELFGEVKEIMRRGFEVLECPTEKLL